MGKNVTIIDYGLGNLRSVMRGIEAAGARAIITGNAEEIAAADGIVLPGVGAFHEGMDQLGPLKETVCAATREVPLLGICLGMQMLMDSSEEHGTHEGLGLIPGRVRRFPHVPGVKVPHMGWNTIRLNKGERPALFQVSRMKSTCILFIHIMPIRHRNIPLLRRNIFSPLPRPLSGIPCTACSSTRKRAGLSACGCSGILLTLI